MSCGLSMKVSEGVWVSYQDMYGKVDFVSQQYFVIKIAEPNDTHGAVRVVVNWDSSYTVHEPSPAPVDAVLLEHLQETYGHQHRDQGHSGTPAGN